MITIDQEDLKMVISILKKHIPDRQVVVFGSRVTGKAKPYSDLDLAILGDQLVPSDTLAFLREDFSQFTLPFRVDLVEWAMTGPEFRKIIQKHHHPL
ncbi:nucleotidyltransferase domain-containing protein [Candidatus Uhrbacteria bacterium]|nr:nucleotidyltransferase domain-containing protein [Candidatus Uhrbacteria bacterium]